MAQTIEEARQELDEQYRKVREDLEDVRMAMIAVDQAGPEDDLYDRLEALEKAAGKVRSGGLVGSGANGHRKALERYLEIVGR
ncbi:MAG: hypothetical protein ACR2KO_09895 [Geodermatophilaceae bacterium]|jgi:hypothetical protein|nr:hypothetical protein [Actinomycetota bacterium]